jgi:hypothetical protein
MPAVRTAAKEEKEAEAKGLAAKDTATDMVMASDASAPRMKLAQRTLHAASEWPELTPTETQPKMVARVSKFSKV